MKPEPQNQTLVYRALVEENEKLRACCGNVHALREALEIIANSVFEVDGISERNMFVAMDILETARRALMFPPRNCDLYTNQKDFLEAHDAWADKLKSRAEYQNPFYWAFEPASEWQSHSAEKSAK